MVTLVTPATCLNPNLDMALKMEERVQLNNTAFILIGLIGVHLAPEDDLPSWLSSHSCFVLLC